jgi:hypothetical protein
MLIRGITKMLKLALLDTIQWDSFFFSFSGDPSLFFPVDMRSKYNMVKTNRVKYS